MKVITDIRLAYMASCITPNYYCFRLVRKQL